MRDFRESDVESHNVTFIDGFFSIYRVSFYLSEHPFRFRCLTSVIRG